MKEMLVRNLMLQTTADQIGDDLPLFGPNGLGLDSIDALELVVSMEKTFGVGVPNSGSGRESTAQRQHNSRLHSGEARTRPCQLARYLLGRVDRVDQLPETSKIAAVRLEDEAGQFPDLRFVFPRASARLCTICPSRTISPNLSFKPAMAFSLSGFSMRMTS